MTRQNKGLAEGGEVQERPRSPHCKPVFDTLSKTRRGGRHDNLTNTLGLSKCNPLKNPGSTLVQ